MTGGGIERVLRITSAALTGRPSRGSAIPGATGCPREGHCLSHEPGRTRCLATLPPPERYKGRHSPSIDRLRWAENRSLRSVFTLLRIEGRPVSAAAKNSAGHLPLELLRAAKYRPYLAHALVSTTGLPRRVGRRIARRIAAASRRGYRRCGAAQARLREATDSPLWPSHPPLTTPPASQPLARSSDSINHMTITKEETAMNTATLEYESVGTGTGLAVPTSTTTPTTTEKAATTEAEAKRPVPARIGRAQLQAIAERLDDTDRALLAAHRYATTRQLAQITALSGQYGSARSALRQTSRRMRRQHGLGLVDHLARRIGGTRAGSAGYVWYLTAAGQRLTSEGHGRGARRRFQEPSALFLAHTLAITQARVVIEQAIHAVGGHLARLRTEPACWRSWLHLGGTLSWLKPDLEAITATDAGAEDHWLLEVDLDTEHPARLLAKCHDYQAHLASGTFQAHHGYYPPGGLAANQPGTSRPPCRADRCRPDAHPWAVQDHRRPRAARRSDPARPITRRKHSTHPDVLSALLSPQREQ